MLTATAAQLARQVSGGGGGWAGLASPRTRERSAARLRKPSGRSQTLEEPPLRPLILVSFLLGLGALALLLAAMITSWYIPIYHSYDQDSNATATATATNGSSSSSSSNGRHCVVVQYQSWRQHTAFCQDCGMQCAGRRSWRGADGCAFQNDDLAHRCANQASLYSLVLGLLVVGAAALLLACGLTLADAFHRLPGWGGRMPVLLFLLHLAALGFVVAAWALFAARLTTNLRQDGGAVCRGPRGPCVSLRGCTRLDAAGQPLGYRWCWGPGTGFLLAVVAAAVQLGALVLLLVGKLQTAVRLAVHDVAGRADDLEQVLVLICVCVCACSNIHMTAAGVGSGRRGAAGRRRHCGARGAAAAREL